MPQVGLQHGDRRRVAQLRLDAVDELRDRALLDRVLAERRQHVRDVLHERPVRADHEDAAARQGVAVRVEQERGAVQPDGGLAGARPALDHERRRRLGRDQPVLVGLDRRDDVAHVHVAVALELLEQEVADGRAVEDRAVERLVGDVDHAPPVRAEAAAQADAVRIDGRRGVERPRRGRLPVDDDLPALLVVHPAAPDVERPRHLLEVEATEAEPLLGVLERPQALGGPRVHRGLRDLAVDAVACSGDRVAHALEMLVGAIDVGLLGRELRVAHTANLARGFSQVGTPAAPAVVERA